MKFSSFSRSALQGIIFGFSAIITVIITAIVYAAASWGSLPTVNTGSGLSSNAWNDLVAHVNQSVKQASPIIAVNGSNMEVNGQVKIVGGSPGVGKVLTSDMDGLATWQAPASGKVLQVGYVAKTDSWSALTSGNNFYTVPGLSATLTPTSTSNKVLITLSLYGGTSYYQIKFRILRNGSPIILGAGEGGRPTTTGMINLYSPATAGNQTYQVAFLGGTYMDNPSTTSATIYQVQMAAYDTSTVYLNRSNVWQNNQTAGYDATPVSTMTVMEIAN